MSATGQPNGTTARRVYTSSSSADTTTWTAGGAMADWVHVVGIGTTVLKDEGGASVTLTTDASEPSLSLPGPWSAFTSTTSGVRVTLGNGGQPPPVVVPASAVPATTAALGGVKLSVAPLSATSPIAAGSNDPRLLTVEASIPLSGTDGSLAEQTIWTAPVACTVVSAAIETGSASTSADNSNYLTVTLANRPVAGPGTPATVASANTKSTSLNGTTAWTEASLGAITNASMVALDRLTFKSVKTGTGQAAATGILRVVISVP